MHVHSSDSPPKNPIPKAEQHSHTSGETSQHTFKFLDTSGLNKKIIVPRDDLRETEQARFI